jgi:hypothetical protein
VSDNAYSGITVPNIPILRDAYSGVAALIMLVLEDGFSGVVAPRTRR